MFSQEVRAPEPAKRCRATGMGSTRRAETVEEGENQRSLEGTCATVSLMEAEDAASRVERYFDALGDKEWDRLESDLRSRVSLEMHRRFLRRWVAPR